MDLYQQFFHHPAIDGVDGPGMHGVEGSFCVRDSAGIVHDGKMLIIGLISIVPFPVKFAKLMPEIPGSHSS
jgi:hypothetical protein